MRLTDRKRNDIIEAATHEFKTRGYSATSMDKIAATAGVSKRTVYNHFPSKKALFREIIAVTVDKIMAVSKIPYSPEKSLREQLKAITYKMIEFHSDTNFVSVARFMIAEFLNSPKMAEELFEEIRTRESGFKSWARAAHSDGRLKVTDEKQAAQYYGAIVKEFVFWPQVLCGRKQPKGQELDKLVDSIVDVFLAAYEV